MVPLFLKQRESGSVTITDDRMTRFWLSLDQGVQFVIDCIEQMEGGEVFVPKIPSTKVIDLAQAIVPNAKVNIIGIRPGEKLHEDLISDDEARHTIELDKMYVIQPAEATWFGYSWKDKGKPLPEGFTYTSDNNSEWLDIEGIKKFVAPFEEAFSNRQNWKVNAHSRHRSKWFVRSQSQFGDGCDSYNRWCRPQQTGWHPLRTGPGGSARSQCLLRLIDAARADAVIHTAANADVDACKSDPEGAHRLNADLPGELAAACAARDVRLIHISTDSVFDGTDGGVYTEDELPIRSAFTPEPSWRVSGSGCRANP